MKAALAKGAQGLGSVGAAAGARAARPGPVLHEPQSLPATATAARSARNKAEFDLDSIVLGQLSDQPFGQYLTSCLTSCLTS